MSYAEAPAPPGFESLVACVWRGTTTGGAVLPDGCADIVWTGDRLLVAGPATRQSERELPAGIEVFGVRFRVGAAGAALGVPAHELLDRSVPVDEVWGRSGAELTRRVEDERSVAPVLRALADRAGRADEVVRAAVAGEPAWISERQLRRRFSEAVGYGPALLRRVLRLQRFLAASRPAAGRAPLGALAASAGYADQAHLNRDSRALTGRTPGQLVGGGAHAAGERGLLR